MVRQEFVLPTIPVSAITRCEFRQVGEGFGVLEHLGLIGGGESTNRLASSHAS